jgi:two-component system chemotaxis response regulator CheB
MSLRVLVVDDTTIFRRVVSSILSEVPGVEVVGTASNGKIAMARIAALRPDLVTLDIEMPEMNGIEVLEAMRAAGITAGVIMLSALTVRGGQMTVRALEEINAYVEYYADHLPERWPGDRDGGAAVPHLPQHA